MKQTDRVVKQTDREFLVEEIRTHIEDHEDRAAEHIERHISRHLTSVVDLILDYEKHSRRRSWISSIVTGILAITNVALITIILMGGAECLSWYGPC